MLYLLLGLACGGSLGEGDLTWELVERSDDGAACLEAPVAGADGEVIVVADVCLSSSCDRAAVGSCTATLEGDTITVSSSFSWESAVDPEYCTDDCGSISARCGVGPLPEGTYTLVHGDQEEQVTIPTQVDCPGG